MMAIDDERARAELIAMNARQIEIAILRLIRRLDAGEVAALSLAEGRKVFAGLAARYEAAARREAGGWRLSGRQSGPIGQNALSLLVPQRRQILREQQAPTLPAQSPQYQPQDAPGVVRS